MTIDDFERFDPDTMSNDDSEWDDEKGVAVPYPEPPLSE